MNKISTQAELSLSFFFELWGKRADVTPNGEQLPSPVDTQNTRGITTALSAFGGLGREWREGLGIWA